MDGPYLTLDELGSRKAQRDAYAMRETLKFYGLLTAASDEIGGRKRVLKSTTAISETF